LEESAADKALGFFGYACHHVECLKTRFAVVLMMTTPSLTVDEVAGFLRKSSKWGYTKKKHKCGGDVRKNENNF
jgi:hypothetical protein